VKQRKTAATKIARRPLKEARMSRSFVIRHWSFVIGHWSFVIRHWSFVIGHWSLVISHWSLVIGHWSLVIRHWSILSFGELRFPLILAIDMALLIDQ